MKIVFLLVALLVNNFLQAQAKWNFHYLQNLYELSVDTPKNGESHVNICNQLNKCELSKRMLWPFQKIVFQTEFINTLTLVDSSFAKTSDSEKAAIADSAYSWIVMQYTSIPKSSVADQLSEIKKIVEKDSEKEKIGVLYMNKNDILIDSAKHKIKEVYATIENGVIGKRALYVVMDDGRIFFNKSAPVNFPRFDKRQEDLLSLWQGDGKVQIKLGHVLNYLSFGKLYYPADEEIHLLPEEGKDRDTLHVSSSLNNMIEMSVYTDLLGVLGDKPNGLLQTEITGNFISNTACLPNYDITFHHFMRPYLRLSRFDSKFRNLDSSRIKPGPKGDTLDRTYMSQISYLQAGLKINIVKIGFGINQVLQLNGGAEVNLVNADSVYKKDLTYFNYYGELNYLITRLKNFGMEAALRWSWQFLSSANNDKIRIQNNNSELFFNPMFNLYYFPSSNSASKVYFRFSYMANHTSGSSNYTQFQVGYKTNLKLK